MEWYHKLKIIKIEVEWDLQGHTLEETELPETLYVPDRIKSNATDESDLHRRIDEWLSNQYDWCYLNWQIVWEPEDTETENVLSWRVVESKRISSSKHTVNPRPWKRFVDHIVDQKKRASLLKNIRHNSKETSKLLTSVVLGLGMVSDAINDVDFGDKDGGTDDSI